MKMFTYPLAQFAFQLGYCQRMLADIDDAQLAVQAIPGANHPAWIVGHLCFAEGQGLRLIGQPSTAPPSYSTLFGIGSKPQTDRALYPSKAELLETLAATHAALTEALPQVPAEVLSRPHPVAIPGLQLALPTVGHLLVHLLTTHEAGHLGQLSYWRRAMGKEPLF